MTKNFSVKKHKTNGNLIFVYRSNGKKLYCINTNGQKVQVRWTDSYSNYERIEGDEATALINQYGINADMCK